jgi:hypothetical protein
MCLTSRRLGLVATEVLYQEVDLNFDKPGNRRNLRRIPELVSWHATTLRIVATSQRVEEQSALQTFLEALEPQKLVILKFSECSMLHAKCLDVLEVLIAKNPLWLEIGLPAAAQRIPSWRKANAFASGFLDLPKASGSNLKITFGYYTPLQTLRVVTEQIQSAPGYIGSASWLARFFNLPPYSWPTHEHAPVIGQLSLKIWDHIDTTARFTNFFDMLGFKIISANITRLVFKELSFDKIQPERFVEKINPTSVRHLTLESCQIKEWVLDLFYNITSLEIYGLREHTNNEWLIIMNHLKSSEGL